MIKSFQMVARVLTNLVVFCYVFTSHWPLATGHSSLAYAQVPRLIRYQGQAVSSQGVPLDGSYTLIFRLYEAETGGKKVWEETWNTVPITSGKFSVLLGEKMPLTSMGWNEPCWLSVQVNQERELAPRQRLTSVPTALRAEGLGDMSVRVYNSQAINTPNDRYWPLTFDSDTWDPNDMHTTSGDKTSRLTAPVDGKYFIYGHVGFDASGVGFEEIVLRVNGDSSFIASQSFMDTTNSSQTKLQVATYARLSKGDYVELLAYHYYAPLVPPDGPWLPVMRQYGISPEFGMTKVE